MNASLADLIHAAEALVQLHANPPRIEGDDVADLLAAQDGAGAVDQHREQPQQENATNE